MTFAEGLKVALFVIAMVFALLAIIYVLIKVSSFCIGKVEKAKTK